MRHRLKKFALAATILGGVAIGGVLAGVPAHATSTVHVGAASRTAHALNNGGPFCENFFGNSGVNGFPCIVFSAGEVRGFMNWGSIAPGCTFNIFIVNDSDGLVGPVARNLACKEQAGTLFESVPQGNWHTEIELFVNGVFQESGQTNDHFGP